MNTWVIWTLALIVLGIFIYFVPYRNIKIVQNKLDKVIELLEKKNNQALLNSLVIINSLWPSTSAQVKRPLAALMVVFINSSPA